MQEDGVQFSKEDAQLKLDEGTPRFYIMRECYMYRIPAGPGVEAAQSGSRG